MEEQQQLDKLSKLLIGSALPALRTRILCAFESENDFQDSMKSCRDQLELLLPKTTVAMFYSSENGELKALEELLLRNLVMLSLAQQKIKDSFTSEDRSSLTKLNDVFMRMYCMRYGIEGSHNDLPLADMVFEVLEGIGMDKRGIENAFEEEKDGEEMIEKFWKDLELEDMFILAFLKRARSKLEKMKENQEELDENWKNFEERLRKVQNQSSVGLDGFANLRQSLERHLSEFLVCKICSKPLNLAKTLPCLHSFCSGCLKEDLNANEKTVTCRICHTRISAPDATAIDSFPCTFVLKGLLALQKKLKSDESKATECNLCVTPATVFCLQNAGLYCGDHTAGLYHRDNDQLLPATDLLDTDRLLAALHCYCPQHSLQLHQFCCSCQVPLCNSSACVTWHAQHGELRSLTDAKDDEKNQLKHLASLMEKKMSKVEGKVYGAEANQVQVADLQENIRESIAKYFADIQQALEERKTEFLRDLNKAAELCWHQDEHTRQTLSSWKEKATKLVDEVHSLDHQHLTNGAASGQNSPVTNMAALKRSLLHQLADTASGNTLTEAKSLSYPEGHLRTLLQTCGNLKSGLTAVSMGRGWELVTKFPGLKYFLVNRNSLFALKKTILSGSSVLVFDLKDFNAPPTAFCESANHDYQAVAVNAQGQLMIPEETQSNLELPSLRLKKSVNLATYSASKERSNIVNLECLNTFARIDLKSVVVNRGKNALLYLADDQCICELDEKGAVQRKFDFYTMVSISDYAPESERDILFVTDASKHNLLIFNCRQQDMVTVGGQGATPGTFSYPTGVCVDHFGHVFVADGGNSRIQIFDLGGKFQKLLPYPQSLRELVSAPNVSANARVMIQCYEDYLYLMDSRMPNIWRLKYL